MHTITLIGAITMNNGRIRTLRRSWPLALLCALPMMLGASCCELTGDCKDIEDVRSIAQQATDELAKTNSPTSAYAAIAEALAADPAVRTYGESMNGDAYWAVYESGRIELFQIVDIDGNVELVAPQAATLTQSNARQKSFSTDNRPAATESGITKAQLHSQTSFGTALPFAPTAYCFDNMNGLIPGLVRTSPVATIAKMLEGVKYDVHTSELTVEEWDKYFGSGVLYVHTLGGILPFRTLNATTEFSSYLVTTTPVTDEALDERAAALNEQRLTVYNMIGYDPIRQEHKWTPYFAIVSAAPLNSALNSVTFLNAAGTLPLGGLSPWAPLSAADYRELYTWNAMPTVEDADIAALNFFQLTTGSLETYEPLLSRRIPPTVTACGTALQFLVEEGKADSSRLTADLQVIPTAPFLPPIPDQIVTSLNLTPRLV